MRHRSKTNSHPYEDAQLHAEYEDANRYDELAKHFPESWNGPGWTTIPGTVATHVRAHETPATQTHHIGWGGQRWDRVWNLIRLGDHSHGFCHMNKWDGLALCIHEKIRKGEWFEDQARNCLGYDVMGKLFYQPCRYPFAEQIRQQLMERKWG